jgi:hypothetical protein
MESNNPMSEFVIHPRSERWMYTVLIFYVRNYRRVFDEIWLVMFHSMFRQRMTVQSFIIRVTQTKLKDTLKPQNRNCSLR